MNRFELKISPEKEMIAIALQAAQAYAKQYITDKKDIKRLTLSLEEAIANVLTYSLTDSVKDITVAAEAQDGELKLSVIDQGIPGDYEDTLKDEDALGLTIMHHSVDQVNIRNLGQKGRCQELIKYYSYRPSYDKEEEKETAKPAVERITEFEIMPMRREDALMVGRGLYKEYGFSYIKELAYYPDRLYAATKKGQLYSAVAVTPDGKAVGHLAVWEWDDIPGIWESGMAVTDPACRGSGVFEKLHKHICEYTENQAGAKVHLGTATTSHILSQKGGYRHGHQPFGLIMNVFDSTQMQNTFKDDKASAERDGGLYMGEILDHERKTVYVPEELRTIIESRYALVGAERDIITDELDPVTEATELDLHYKPAWHYGRICCFTIGPDFAACLRRELLTAKRNDAISIELCISMETPGVTKAYEEAKKLGFFFAGIIPGSQKGDILLMSKMLSSTVNYDFIHVIDPAKDLLETVRSFDPDQK